MATKTVQDKIKEMTQPKPDKAAEELRILSMLPPNIPAPVITVFRDSSHLGFSGPAYDPENTFDPVGLLATLHIAGWKTEPATLVQKDKYRPAPEPGLQENIPEEMGSCFGRPYKVTATWPICPAWVIPNQYTGPEFKCYLRAPDDRVYEVCVSVKNLPCRISAERHEYRGGWDYRRGTARLYHPNDWLEIIVDGNPIADKHEKSRAQVDTAQGISGQLYWTPTAHEQADFPMSAAEMLAWLLDHQK